MLILCAFSFLLLEANLALGLHIPFLQPSQTLLSSSGAPGANPYALKNHGNVAYTTNVTLNGRTFEVVLDTGSSDLWLNTENVELSGIKDSGISVPIVHRGIALSKDPLVTGAVSVGNFTWGGHAVQNQTFVHIGSSKHLKSRYHGVLGLAPPGGSNMLRKLVKHPEYNTTNILNHVFNATPHEPNLITLGLTRNNLSETVGGVFTIGEIEPGYRRIIQSPRLAVVSDVFWGTFMDGIIVNGRRIKGGSQSHNMIRVPAGKTLVSLDSGMETALAPAMYVDAMYSKLPGAKFDGRDGYNLPCDTRVNISLVFGGTRYPIHPIDAVGPEGLDKHGKVKCVGKFRYTPRDFGLDFVLGTTFLRNVYSLFDYGYWTPGVKSLPYVQLLSVVNPNKAWQDFPAMNTERVRQLTNPNSPSGTPSVYVASAISQPQVAAPTATPSIAQKIKKNMDWSFWLIFGLLGLVIMLFVFLAIDRVYGIVSGKGYKSLDEQNRV